jgi:predicted phosphoribosyltransferase
MRQAGATNVILAIPTARSESVQMLLKEVEAIYCPNLRSGLSFAVADAYEQWSDLDEPEVIRLLQEFENPNQRSTPNR